MNPTTPTADLRIDQALEKALGSTALLDSLPVGVYCCDRDGIVWVFNRRAAELWGRSPTPGDRNHRFNGAVALFRPDGSPLPHEEGPMAMVLRSGIPQRDQRIIIGRPDGGRIPTLSNIEPLFDDQGRLVGAVNCFQDITRLAHVEDRLRDDEQRFRDVLAAMPVAVYTTDAEGRVTFYNEAAVALAGRRPELGSDQWCASWRLYTADGKPLPHDQCPMALALRERRPVRDIEAILERPDGSRLRFLPFPTPLFDANGRLTGAVNMLLDITDRHAASVESARLAAIVASSDDAIVSKSLDGIIRSWNGGATRIFGYEPQEMIGQPILRIIPPELHDQEQEILARLRRGERIEHFETVRVTKDGRRLDISLTVSPVRDKLGSIVGASKVARDITERKRAEELQRLLLGELNHRVKNTLATVQSIANQSVRHAQNPVTFLSSFSGRIQALAQAHDLLTQNSWRGADILPLVRDQLLAAGSGDERISFSGPSVMLDPQAAVHLAMILHELGTNARKYGSLSVPAGRLAVSWRVQTNGRRDLHLRWQESKGPPVTAPSARGFGSTLIEKSLAAHDGEASIHYGADGVTCEIRLPLPEGRLHSLAARMALPQAAPAPVPDRPEAAPGLCGRRVLVVEDEPLIAMDIAATLTDAGCAVVGPASSVEEAKALIADAAFDAALLDANLGGRPVDELAAALTRQAIPFAFLTGYGREGLPEAYRHAPMIGKPFTPEHAFDVLGQLLRQGGKIVPLRQKGT
ncbi:MAG TPA: PAS domain S-box protein [Candidatus Acidoferrum sp.]|nr:PAS domain S-box protein [Candidatus Acidoferrum sp.]